MWYINTGAVIVIIVGSYYLYGIFLKEIWRELKTFDGDISFVEYVIVSMKLIYARLPRRTIFMEYAKIKKSHSISNLPEMQDSYKLISSAVNDKLKIYKKRSLHNSLILFRIGSSYILGGNIFSILETIKTSGKINTLNIVSTRLQKKVDIKHLEEINILIDKLLTLLSENIKEFPLIGVGDFERSENLKSRDTLTSYSLDELRNQLRSINTYFIEDIITDKKTKPANKEKIQTETNNEPLHLDKIIFQDTVNVLIKAQQAKLNITLNDLSIYLKLNGDIERTINELIKTRQFDFSTELEEIRKYIYIDYNIEESLSQLIRARKAGVTISLDDLEEHNRLGGDVEIFADSLIKAKYSGIDIDMKAFNKYFSQGGDIKRLVDSLVKLKHENISIDFNDLSTLKLEGGDIIQIVDDIIRAKHVGLNIPFDNIKSYLSQNGDAHILFDVLIKANESDLDINITDLEELTRIGADLELFYKTMNLNKKFGLNIEKEKLVSMQTSGAAMFDYVRAVNFNKAHNFNLNIVDIESDLLEQRKVLDILFAMIRAKSHELDFKYDFGILLDKAEHDIAKVLDWALNPKSIKIELDYIITKNAFSIKLFLNVMVRGKLGEYLKGAKEDVLKERVNEAVIKEIELLNNYQEVLESLNYISERVFKRLNADMNSKDFPNVDASEIIINNKREAKSNQSSAYEILDVNIQNIELGTDRLAKLKKEIAQLDYIIATSKSHERRINAIAQASEAKAKLVESEAELKRGLAKAFTKGYLSSTNEYHKRKVFDDAVIIHPSHDLHDNIHQHEKLDEHEHSNEETHSTHDAKH